MSPSTCDADYNTNRQFIPVSPRLALHGGSSNVVVTLVQKLVTAFTGPDSEV